MTIPLVLVNELQIRKVLSDVYLEHLETIVHSVFMPGYKDKVVNTEFFREKHRTTVSHFLNNGKWNSLQFEKALKRQVIDRIYGESRKSGEPVFCIVDDTIASHTKPSSQAAHPIEAAYYVQLRARLTSSTMESIIRKLEKRQDGLDLKKITLEDIAGAIAEQLVDTGMPDEKKEGLCERLVEVLNDCAEPCRKQD